MKRRALVLQFVLSLFAWLVYIFLAVPSLLVIPMAFAGKDDLRFPPRSYSLYLFYHLFNSSVWSGALLESVIVSFFSTIIASTFGTLAAFALVRGRFRGRTAIGLVLLMPLLLPTIVLALGIYLYFVRLGLTGTTLGLILAQAVLALPYPLVMAATGLRQIDPAVEQAATSLGASYSILLLRIIIPQIALAIRAGALFAFLMSFNEVVVAWFISGTGATTLPVEMYASLQTETSPIIAAAAALFAGVSIVVCCLSAVLGRSAAQNAMVL